MPELSSYERRFRRAGLPLFIEDYSASEDIFTRATPVLALVFIGELLGTAGNVLITLDVFGDPVQITEELLRVSGGIAAFSGLYYAIAVLTDSTYREEFLEEITEEMGDTFRARAEYLDARAGTRAG